MFYARPSKFGIKRVKLNLYNNYANTLYFVRSIFCFEFGSKKLQFYYRSLTIPMANLNDAKQILISIWLVISNGLEFITVCTNVLGNIGPEYVLYEFVAVQVRHICKKGCSGQIQKQNLTRVESIHKECTTLQQLSVFTLLCQ